jgi:hypothetical protein
MPYPGSPLFRHAARGYLFEMPTLGARCTRVNFSPLSHRYNGKWLKVKQFALKVKRFPHSYRETS